MKIRVLIAALAFGALMSSAALAGPPLICRPLDIAGARSLPWSQGTSWNGALATYDRRRAAADTLAVLVPGTPVEVRMETLRRAAIYTWRDPAQAHALLERLVARTRGGNEDSTALFDAGYFAEASHEAAEFLPHLHN